MPTIALSLADAAAQKLPGGEPARIDDDGGSDTDPGSDDDAFVAGAAAEDEPERPVDADAEDRLSDLASDAGDEFALDDDDTAAASGDAAAAAAAAAATATAAGPEPIGAQPKPPETWLRPNAPGAPQRRWEYDHWEAIKASTKPRQLPKTNGTVRMVVPKNYHVAIVGDATSQRLSYACLCLAKDRHEYLALLEAREAETHPNHKRVELACRFITFLNTYRRLGTNNPKRKQEALRFLETWHVERGAYQEELAIARRVAGIKLDGVESQDVVDAELYVSREAANVLRAFEKEAEEKEAQRLAAEAALPAKRAKSDKAWKRLWDSIPDGDAARAAIVKQMAAEWKRTRRPDAAQHAQTRAANDAERAEAAALSAAAAARRNALYNETLARVRAAKQAHLAREQADIAEARAELARRAEKKRAAKAKKEAAAAKSAVLGAAREAEWSAANVFTGREFFAGLTGPQLAARFTKAKGREKTRKAAREAARERFLAEDEDELRSLHLELLPNERAVVAPPRQAEALAWAVEAVDDAANLIPEPPAVPAQHKYPIKPNTDGEVFLPLAK